MTLPKRVLKAYKCREFARRFVEEGEIRLGSLESYRISGEAEKADPSEGYASFRVPGMVPRVSVDRTTGVMTELPAEEGWLHYHGEWRNPFYLFCVSQGDIDQEHQTRALGPHVVEVFDVAAFVRELDSATKDVEVSGHNRIVFEVLQVAYDKEGVKADSDAHALVACVATKPPRFAPDREVRIVVGFGGPLSNTPDHIMVRLGQPMSYCRLLSAG